MCAAEIPRFDDLSLDPVRIRGPALVGVSGGSDSVALLCAAIEKRMARDLHVVHVNHGWRSSAKDDQEFVAKLAEAKGLAFHSKRLSPDGQTTGFEEWGRLERLKFFAEVARRVGAKHVLLGHTLDDRLETILLRIDRGSGLRGLQGIKPQTALRIDDTPLTLVRPLLACRRPDLRTILRRSSQAFRDDPSNEDLRFRRNWIRHRVLPALRNEPHFEDGRLLELAGLATHFSQIAQRRLLQAASPTPPAWSGRAFCRSKINELSPTLILTGLQSLWDPGKDLGIRARGFEALRRSLTTHEPFRVVLRENLEVRTEQGLVLLGYSQTIEFPSHLVDGDIDLEVAYWPAKIRIRRGVRIPDSRPETSIVIDLSKVAGGLRWRLRRPGDHFAPGIGLNVKRKFQARKIPPRLRDALPVLVLEDHLVWIPTVAIDRRILATESTPEDQRLWTCWQELGRAPSESQK